MTNSRAIWGWVLQLDSAGNPIWSQLDSTGLPVGTETGQTLIWNQEEGKWEVGSLSGGGVPIGQLTFLPYDAAPAGFYKISYHQETGIHLTPFPGAVKLACPAEYNDMVDFFYRCDNANGTGRNVNGMFVMMPAAARYFFRAHDPDGGAGQYQYQEDQMQGHFHKQNPEGNIISQQQHTPITPENGQDR